MWVQIVFFRLRVDLDIVRSISDNEEVIPLKHDKSLRPEGLPDSLKKAIQVYVG